jgi:hypothetical protein
MKMSAENPTYFYFTNQRNLLQAITKGYFCNPAYWDRKADEFEEEVGFLPNGYLWFSATAFDLRYSHKNDKTLLPVAIGLKDEKLLELGFVKTKLNEDQWIFIGDKTIPMDVVHMILFRSQEDLSQLRMRYGEYLKLLDDNVFGISKNGEFDYTIEAPSEIKKIPKVKMSNEIESRLSKSIGAIGNSLIQLNEDNKNSHIILFDITNSYLRDEIKCDYLTIRKDFEQFNWNITDEDITAIAVMIVSNRDDELKTQIKHIKKFANTAKINIKGFDIKLSLVFLNSINRVLYKINENIKTLDRITILDEVIEQLKNDLITNKIKDKSTLEILKTIKGVFDYRVDLEDIYKLIDDINCNLIKIIMRGFHIYIREPVEKEKIKVLIEQENNLPSELCKVLPLFIWGKARGAFSFEPNSKNDILGRMSNKGFYLNCFDMKSLKDFNFSLINETITDDGEFSPYGNYKIDINKKDSIEHKTYEEIKYSIQTSTGLTLFENKKDEYTDVFKEVVSLIDQNKLSDEDMEYLLKEHLKSEVSIEIGNKHFSVEGVEDINIGGNSRKEIQFQSQSNLLNASINMERSLIHDQLILFLKERYNELDYHKRISLSEKKKLRKYFSLNSGSTFPQVSKTKKEILDSDQKKTIEKMTKSEIKDLMKKDNIKPLTGNKEDLILRVKAHKRKIGLF